MKSLNIDLRSDTITKPTKEMLKYMLNAKVGDDVWEEDETVKELEDFLAILFSKIDKSLLSTLIYLARLVLVCKYE